MAPKKKEKSKTGVEAAKKDTGQDSGQDTGQDTEQSWSSAKRKQAPPAELTTKPASSREAGKKGRGRRINALTADKKTQPSETPFDCHTNEPKVAAYLGYSDVACYRQFRFSPPVLQAYMRYIKVNATKKSYKAALEVISDLGIEALDRHAKLEDQPPADKLAIILEDLVEQTEKMKDQLPKEIEQAFVQSRDIFIKTVMQKKGLTFPQIDMKNLRLPVFGPRKEFNESALERHARAFNLLMSLDHVLAPSRFRSVFVNTANPFGVNPVNYTAIPTFMQLTKKNLNDVFEKKNPLSPLSLWVVCKLTPDVDDHLKTKQRECNIPTKVWECFEGGFRPEHDPRLYKGTQWRDLIRKHLQFPILGVDFEKITIHEMDRNATDGPLILVSKDMMNNDNSENLATWEEIKKWLNNGREFQMDFTLTLDVEDIEEEYVFEYKGPPLALVGDAKLSRDADVVFTHADPQSKAQETASEEQLRQIEEIIDAGATAAPTVPKVIDPTERFDLPSEEKAFLKYYNGYDVRTAAGLLGWQRFTLDKIIGSPTRPKYEKLSGTHKVTRDQLAAMRNTSQTIEAEMLLRDERHFRVEAAFQGTNIYTGPQVDHCHTLMNMERVATHGPTDEYPLSKCHELPTCKATFLDCQINGAAWMLMRTFGQIPMSNDRLNAITAASQERSRYIETLRKKHVAVETRGGILGDGTGMGKTFTTLLYLSYQARHIAEFHTSINKHTPDHKFAHKPSLILAPSSTVLVQWADLVSKLFPNLYLVVGFGDTAPKPALARSFVKSAAMREFEAGKPESLKRWPEHLKFMWDQNDPKASSVVILTTYDTISERIVSIREQEASEPEGKKEKILANRWKGCIETVVMNEGHKVRHPRTKIHTMVKQFRARSHWFITATPTVNSVLDILGLLDIQWQGLLPIFHNNPNMLTWMDEASQRGWQGLRAATELPEHDKRRLIFLNPKRVESLLQASEVSAVSELFPHIDALITLKRAPSSNIMLNDTQTQSLRGLMPQYTVKTELLTYRPEERAEAQWLHRGHAREYVQAVKASLRSGESDSRLTGEKKAFPPTIAHLRRLCICSASNLLGRFDLFLRRYGMNTLVSDMDKFRQGGRNLDWFLHLVHRPGDPDLDSMTHVDKLVYLCWGSPKARALCEQIRDFQLPDEPGQPYRKVLYGEDTVPVAWFWEILFTGLFLTTTVLHAQLSNQERINIVNSFNDRKDPLCCLISMFGVSTQGTNFHQSCCRVVVATPALNAPTEVQFWGRVIRLNQGRSVTVTRLKTLDSHDQYRDSKQADKAFMELATRALDPVIQTLLVELLNENTEEVKRAHETQDRKAELGIRPKIDATFDFGSAMVIADSVAGEGIAEFEVEMGDAEPAPEGPRRSIRSRKQVEKLDKEYLNSQVYLDDDDNDGFDEIRSPTKKSKSQVSGKARALSYEYEDDAAFTDEDDPEDDIQDFIGDSDSEYMLDDDSNFGDEDGDADPDLQNFSDMSLDGHSVRALRTAYWKMDKEQMENFDQDDLNERNLLRFKKDYVYTTADLQEPHVLERALRLLFQARFGQEASYWRISPHISYEGLPNTTIKAIEQRMRHDRAEIAELKATMKLRKI